MIDFIGFYAASTIFQPYNGGGFLYNLSDKYNR